MTATPCSFESRVRRLLMEGAPNAAASVVLDTLGPGLLRYLTSMLPGDDAGDAFSELQLTVWRGLPGFRWECPLRAWVYRLARHAAAHVASDGYRRRRLPLPPNVDFGPPVAEEPEEGDRSAQLAALRRELAPEERTLLALRVNRALPWNEVAAILSSAGRAVSSAGLRKRFERLKLKLAGLARERGMVG
jgi:RNA polymerase sigma-70 factor (ECF subfamily)